jgi:hypothetical protein
MLCSIAVRTGVNVTAGLCILHVEAGSGMSIMSVSSRGVERELFKELTKSQAEEGHENSCKTLYKTLYNIQDNYTVTY